MTDLITSKPGVRAEIARQTHAQHVALHTNVVLRHLTCPTVTQSRYLSALRVLQAFYRAVERERQRQNRWSQFALDRECDALMADTATPVPVDPGLRFDNENQLLGALYVALGASFGRNAMRANIRNALPNASHRFLDIRPHKNTWRSFNETLETQGTSPEIPRDIASGASMSFERVALLSRLCA